MAAIRRFAVLSLCVQLVCATSASADVVTDWNAKAAALIITPARGPAVIVDLATLQAAMHDAVQAYEKRFEPYAVDIRGATGSMVAAVATAARDVLVQRFPALEGAVHADYLAYLVSKTLTEDDPGVLIGRQAAAGVLATRINEGMFPPGFPPFTGGNAPYQWRPTPPANAPMFGPWLGAVRTFAINSPLDFEPAPLPGLLSQEYTDDFNEVKALGSTNSTARRPRQTHLANFYSDNFISLWQRTLRNFALAHFKKSGDTARLLALANIAAADAIISCWRSKRDFQSWRPITAIREAETDGNPGTVDDDAWTPFSVTPPYPDYTSGANNLTGSMTRILRLVMDRDNVTFDVESLSATLGPDDAKTIRYKKFSDMAKDVVNVRIYQGIHFRFADVAGRKQGRRVANFVFRNVLRPLDDDDNRGRGGHH